MKPTVPFVHSTAVAQPAGTLPRNVRTFVFGFLTFPFAFLRFCFGFRISGPRP
jgi:hypothetical protein